MYLKNLKLRTWQIKPFKFISAKIKIIIVCFTINIIGNRVIILVKCVYLLLILDDDMRMAIQFCLVITNDDSVFARWRDLWYEKKLIRVVKFFKASGSI